MAKWASRIAASRAPLLPGAIEIEGREIAVEIREHPTARRLVMRIAPGGNAIRITVPRRASRATVLAFLDRHRGWVAQRLVARPAPIVVADGALVPFRGADLRLVHEPGRRQSRLQPGVNGETAQLLVGGEPPHLARRVRDVFQREARRDLEEAVARHCAAAGTSAAAIAVKDTTSRWGSCSAARRLSFSFRLVMAPPFVLDYLAAHEVAHLREMNHGPQFWALCRSLCPDGGEAQAWLKANGPRLHAIRFD